MAEQRFQTGFSAAGLLGVRLHKRPSGMLPANCRPLQNQARFKVVPLPKTCKVQPGRLLSRFLVRKFTFEQKGQGQVRLVVDNYMLDEVHKLLFDGLIHKLTQAVNGSGLLSRAIW